MGEIGTTMDEPKMIRLAVHKVGSKANNDLLVITDEPPVLEDEVVGLLQHYFLSPFKGESRFRLHHDSDLSLNEVYAFASRVFGDPDTFMEVSADLARHLYHVSEHPRIRSGEFYVALFDSLPVEGATTRALGLFKSESKEPFLKVWPQNNGYQLSGEEGININKLDKGCLIFDVEGDEGFVVEAVDHLNKIEARYWFDDFLRLRERKDSYSQTEHALTMAKRFVTSYLPEHYEMDRADEAELLNQSARYFKEQDTFDMESFGHEVFNHPELADTFKQYKSDYEQEYSIQIDDQFDISDRAAKKQARQFKSVLKLDRNFSLYIHGDRSMIQKGWDEERQLHYYQLYFKEEK